MPGPDIDNYIATVSSSGAIKFYHTDKMGSIVAMSDVNGNLAEGPYVYDAYGNCFSAGAACSAGVGFRYTGQRLDPETGLYYYRARYYQPGIGQFLQTDPVGYKDNLNLYGYVGDDPTDKTDPMGQYSTDCGAKDLACAMAANQFERARQSDLRSSNSDVVTAAQAWGDKGVDNGITVQFLSQADMDKNYGEGSRLHIDANVDSAVDSGKFTSTASFEEKGVANAGDSSEIADNLKQTITHEGSHIEDGRKFAGTFNPKTGKYSKSANYTRRQTEFKAYRVGGAVKPYPGLGSDAALNRFITNNYPNADTLKWPEEITE